MSTFVCRFQQQLDDESGSAAIEYALIVGLIVVALLFGLSLVAGANRNTYNTLQQELVVEIG